MQFSDEYLLIHIMYNEVLSAYRQVYTVESIFNHEKTAVGRWF